MQRRSLLEMYALLACLLTLVCFLVTMYYLGRGIVARQAPESTIGHWAYETHQTNDRYWDRVNLGSRRARPPEEILTTERERSWQAELLFERRDGTRAVRLATAGAVVSLIIFWIHWLIARRARRDERGTELVNLRRPFLLASATVFGLSCSCGTGLVAGLLAGALAGYRDKFEEEYRAVNPILADPAFAGIEIRPISSGGIELWGVVPTESDVERLRAQVIRALGERRGTEITRGVQARQVVAPPPAR